jgi:hypothetical protein
MKGVLRRLSGGENREFNIQEVKGTDEEREGSEQEKSET